MSQTIRDNVVKMLQTRGCTGIVDYGNVVECDTCTLFFAGGAKINLAYMSTLIRYMCDGDHTRPHAIVVHDQPANATVRNLVVSLKHVARVELFPTSFFCFPLLEHSLVPKHTRATPQEVRSIGTDAKNLPVLKFSDAIVRYCDFKSGEIVRVDRADNTMVFRIVE